MLYVAPHISKLWDFVKGDDVLFIRGGFKTWHDYLIECKGKQWLLLYAANTGRQKWTFWDVVFNDLQEGHSMDARGRFQFHYKKPTHPVIFHYDNGDRMYDVCIGASHIHDKKGQWLGIKTVAAYNKKYGERLNCVMPGRAFRGVHSNYINQDIHNYKLWVKRPGMVPRASVAKIMRESKLFIHLGGGGQNDRGPLEAMRCGTPVMIRAPHRHAPVVWRCPQNYIADTENPDELASIMREALLAYSEDQRRRVFEYYEANASIENVILPEMKRLFNAIRVNPKPDSQAVAREFLEHQERQEGE